MIGVGWPIDGPPAGTPGEYDFWIWLAGMIALLAFSAAVIWRGRPSAHQRRTDTRIEHPADFRKAA